VIGLDRRARKDFSNAARKRVLDEVYRRGLRHADAYVCEFPKSGGSWVTHLTRDLLTASAHGREPLVLHPHWSYRETYRPALYVLRDGRDVVVSMYFHHVRHLLVRSFWSDRIERYFCRILGPGFDANDARANLPAFIASLSMSPFGGLLPAQAAGRYLTWPAHVRDWVDREGVLVVRYEALHEDAVGELGRIAAHVGVAISPALAEEIVSANSFESRSGRQAGVEDRSSFLRKGVRGDWKQWFSVEAARAFDVYAGDVLVDQGYEPDREWVTRV
jgi:Sulfotransferase domain